MRVAVISDIHGNLHALEAVLADIDRHAPDEVWCLGDVVGYGPRPNECVALARERSTLALCGNHDLAVLGTLDVSDFSGDAAAAVRWTQDVLSPDARTWLGSLQPAAARAGADLFHGSPRDPVWDYVLSEEVARFSLLETEAPIVLVGHTHVPIAVTGDAESAAGGHAAAGYEVDFGTGRWLLNPGSVGQPRDADPRAAYLVLDLDAGRATFRRVQYDDGRTQEAMRAAGLPLALAQRLEYGV